MNASPQAPANVVDQVLTVEEAVQLALAIPETPKKPIDIYPKFHYPPEPEDNQQKKRRKSLKWSSEELQFVLNGYCKFGALWTEILKEYPFHPHRIHTDIRDKWENMYKHESDPNCKRIFDEVIRCVRLRTQFLANPEPPSPVTEPRLPLYDQVTEIFKKLDDETLTFDLM